MRPHIDAKPIEILISSLNYYMHIYFSVKQLQLMIIACFDVDFCRFSYCNSMEIVTFCMIIEIFSEANWIETEISRY